MKQLSLLIMLSLLPFGAQAGFWPSWLSWRSLSVFKAKKQKTNENELKWNERGTTFREAIDAFKTRYEAEVKSSKDASSAAVVDEIRKNGVPDFFSSSKPGYSMRGIFLTSEARSLMWTLREQYEKRQAEQTSSQDPNSEITVQSIKPIKADDIRELSHLGKIRLDPALPEESRYELYFKGSVGSDGKKSLRVSLAERYLGTKKVEERALQATEKARKRKPLYVVVGQEQDNGSFVWRKIVHEGQKLEGSVFDEKDDGLRKAKKKNCSFANDDNIENVRFFSRWNYPEKRPNSNMNK